MLNKANVAKGAGALGAIVILFALMQDFRSEINDLRERVVALETIIGD